MYACSLGFDALLCFLLLVCICGAFPDTPALSHIAAVTLRCASCHVLIPCYRCCYCCVQPMEQARSHTCEPQPQQSSSSSIPQSPGAETQLHARVDQHGDQLRKSRGL
jgi:hypothetical protein